MFHDDLIANVPLSLSVKQILKIGQHLAKLQKKYSGMFFFDSQCSQQIAAYKHSMHSSKYTVRTKYRVRLGSRFTIDVNANDFQALFLRNSDRFLYVPLKLTAKTNFKKYQNWLQMYCFYFILYNPCDVQC